MINFFVYILDQNPYEISLTFYCENIVTSEKMSEQQQQQQEQQQQQQPVMMDNYSTAMVKKIELVSRLLKTREEYQRHIKSLQHSIKFIKKALKNKVRVKSLSRVESNLCILNYYLQTFKINLKQKTGVTNKRTMVWEDAESCLMGRIKSGTITNLKFK